MHNQFQEYKREYSLINTTKERKKELISLMRENLRQRLGEGRSSLLCLDGKEYSVDSESVSDLYAIDGMQNQIDSSAKMNKVSDTMRKESLSRNKYNPGNPCPSK